MNRPEIEGAKSKFWIVLIRLFGAEAIAWVEGRQMTYQTGIFRGRTTLARNLQTQLCISDTFTDYDGTIYKVHKKSLEKIGTERREDVKIAGDWLDPKPEIKTEIGDQENGYQKRTNL